MNENASHQDPNTSGAPGQQASDDPTRNAEDRLMDTALELKLGARSPIDLAPKILRTHKQRAIARNSRLLSIASMSMAAASLVLVAGLTFFGEHFSAWMSGGEQDPSTGGALMDGAEKERGELADADSHEHEHEHENDTEEGQQRRGHNELVIEEMNVIDPARFELPAADHLTIRKLSFTGRAIDGSVLTKLAEYPHALNLIELELFDTDVRDEDLKQLGEITSLALLRLSQSRRISDAGLAHLEPPEKLQALDLAGWVGQTASIGDEQLPEDYSSPYAKFTDACIEQIAKLPSLERLNLYGTGITDAGVDALTSSGLALRLKWVNLSMTRVRAEGVAKLFARDEMGNLHFPKLGWLGIAGLRIGDDTLSAIERAYALGLQADQQALALNGLSLGGTGMGSAAFTDAGFAALGGVASLSELRIKYVDDVTEQGWIKLLTPLAKSLKLLHITGCAGFGDEVMHTTGAYANKSAASLRQLHDVKLSGVKNVSTKGLNAWIPLLRDFYVSRLNLHGLGTRKELAQVDDDFVDQMAELLPSCEIVLPTGQAYSAQFLRLTLTPHEELRVFNGHNRITTRVIIMDSEGRVIAMPPTQHMRDVPVQLEGPPRKAPEMRNVRKISFYGLPSGKLTARVLVEGEQPLDLPFEIRAGEGVTLDPPEFSEFKLDLHHYREQIVGGLKSTQDYAVALVSPEDDPMGLLPPQGLWHASVSLHDQHTDEVITIVDGMWHEQYHMIFNFELFAPEARTARIKAYVKGRFVGERLLGVPRATGQRERDLIKLPLSSVK